VAGRWSVWNDPGIQELARRAVPAADEVWRLQRSDDPEARYFQVIADGGHYRRQGGTRQGIYLITPSGKLLSSVNSLAPEAVRASLTEGFEAWEAMDPAERVPGPGEAVSPRSRWEDDYPDGGLVLRLTVRDLPVEAGDERVPRYNLDHVWVGADEVRHVLPSGLAAGDEIRWPALAERLARFHVVDSALGQTLPYAPEEIEANLVLRVTSVEDGIATMSFEATSAAETDGTWLLGDNDWKPEQAWPRSMTAELHGTARFDLKERRFETLELIGAGRWTGKTRFNGRGDATEGRLGFVFELAPDTPAGRVAPAFVDVYDAPWMTQRASLAGR
jgi:hypothetical protein